MSQFTDSKHTDTEERARAVSLGRWGLCILVATCLLYLAFHFWWLNPSTYGQWYAVTATSARSQRALDWALWGLGGTLLYLMTEFASRYATLGKESKNPAEVTSFINYTPWYISTLIRGPVITVVIIFFLNAANLNLTGPGTGGGSAPSAFSFNFSALDHTVTLFFAFVLGFYSRVARAVLDSIMKSLFPGAWAEAYEDFDIEPSEVKVVIGETKSFKTKPAKVVDWATSLGTIDTSGKYTAPQESECGARASVTAVSGRIARTAVVTLVPFEITGPQSITLQDPSQPCSYGVSKPKSGVNYKWALSPATGGGTINPTNGVYTPPKPAEAQTDKVTITATVEGQDKCTNSLEVSLVQPQR